MLAGRHLLKGRVLRREQRSPRNLTQYAEDADGADGGDGDGDDFPAKEEKIKVNKVQYKSPSKKMGKATDACEINRGRRDPCVNHASTCFCGSIFVFALLSQESSFL